jgi:hypothetical protein
MRGDSWYQSFSIVLGKEIEEGESLLLVEVKAHGLPLGKRVLMGRALETSRKNREGSDMPSPANHREYNLTSTQADQARGDFSVILDELDLVKWQPERLPIRLFLSDVTIGHGERVGSARVSRIVAGAVSTRPSPLAW